VSTTFIVNKTGRLRHKCVHREVEVTRSDKIMYKEFYKLLVNPFEITPDPSFLFPTGRHREALVALYYAVQRRKGFVALTGNVGTGKTLVIHCLLRMLKDTDIACAHVFNSRLSTQDFLNYVATEFGLTPSGKTKAEVLQDLRKCLLARHHKKLTNMIVVDDAQDLPIEVLEEIRLLTNLETEEEKLLQILLVGQHELDKKLDSFELRQLKQRIALRSHLEPFNLEETSGYIRHRLTRAGASPEAHELFPDETIKRIYRFSRGVARLVNTICENALITAFAKQLTSVAPDVIDEVAFDLRLRVPNALGAERSKGSDETLQADEDTALIV
jgi:general secretion pathway protein A